MAKAQSPALALVLLLASLLPAQPVASAAGTPGSTGGPSPCTAAAPAGDGLHAGFDALLRAHVKDGAVEYRCLAGERPALDAYLARLAAVDPATLPTPERMAFWINAYNAWTLRLVLDHYPGIGSIRQLPDPWGTPLAKLAGRTMSLDEIEHGILRKQFDEPRVHFALVCASRSCPDLAAEAYQGAKLEEQLARAAARFFADPAKGLRTGVVAGKLWGETPTLSVSSILDWYGGDFTRRGQGLVEVVEGFAPPAAKAFIVEHRGALRVAFLDYDWSLNGR